MPLFSFILSLALALAMLVSGALKIVRAPRIVRLMAAVGVPAERLPLLGALQIAGTVGLVAVIWLPPLAIAASIGLVLYFIGAIAAHIRAHDSGMQGAVGFLVMSAATLAALLLVL